MYERSRRLNYNKSDIGYALKKLNIYQKDICYVTMP
ncbi:MAG: hypothetical protein ACTHYX_09900 [Psychrobacter sp.]